MKIVGHLRTFSQNLKMRRDDEQSSNLAGCKFSSENKPRVRGPPLCVRVIGVRVKNEFMAKVFLQKIT